MTLSKEILEKLKRPFDTDTIGVKIQSLSKDKKWAQLILYVSHAHVQDRLDEVDSGWTFQALEDKLDKDLVIVKARMTVTGIARDNVGEGDDFKSAYSDALKRCAMLYGVGRYLYDAEQVWVEYDEMRDRRKKWSYEEYEARLKKLEAPKASQNPPVRVTVAPQALKPTPSPAQPTQETPKPAVKRIEPGEDWGDDMPEMQAPMYHPESFDSGSTESTRQCKHEFLRSKFKDELYCKHCKTKRPLPVEG